MSKTAAKTILITDENRVLEGFGLGALTILAKQAA